MHPARRTQSDNKQLEYSLRGGLDCTGSQDMTRQEQRKDADIETIISRFGLDAPAPLREMRYGTWDESIDLQSAYTALDAVASGYRNLPAEVRRQFPTPLIFVNAMASGELAHYIEKEKREAAETAEKTAAKAAGPAGASRDRYEEKRNSEGPVLPKRRADDASRPSDSPNRVDSDQHI